MIILSIVYYKNKNDEYIDLLLHYFSYKSNISENHLKQAIKKKGKLNI